MAINALAAWPRERWDSEITAAVLKAAHEIEPGEDVKPRFAALLAGKTPASGESEEE